MAYYAISAATGLSTMPTRNVVLTEHQEQLIETLVGSGRYQNASEVLREGLRLVEQREAEDRRKARGPAGSGSCGLWRNRPGRVQGIRKHRRPSCLSDRSLGKGHSQRSRIALWRHGNGASASALLPNSISQISSSGQPRILVHGSPESIGTRSLERSASLRTVRNVAGSKARDEIMPGLRTLHVARRGRRGRHFSLVPASPRADH